MIGFGRIGGFLGATALGLLVTVVSCGGGSSKPDGGQAGATGTAGTGAAGTGTAGTIGTAGTTATGGTTGAGGSMTPIQACNMLASTVCARDNTCNTRMATAQDLTDCATAQKVAYGCDRAAAASSGFSACLQDVQLLSCSSLFPVAAGGNPILPGACDDPINAIPLTDAQNTCSDLSQTFCDRVFSCAGVTAPTATQSANCLQDYFDNLGCAYVTAVGTTLAQCKTEIGMLPCPSADGGTSANADGGTDANLLPSCETALTYAP